MKGYLIPLGPADPTEPARIDLADLLVRPVLADPRRLEDAYQEHPLEYARMLVPLLTAERGRVAAGELAASGRGWFEALREFERRLSSTETVSFGPGAL